MNRREFLLSKVIEEALEVAHRAAKILHFTVDEKQPGQGEDNGQRFNGELADFQSLVRMAQDEGALPQPMGSMDFLAHEKAKREKVEWHYKYSQSLGTVSVG